jgi:predicted nucleic acid-binding protein
VKVVLDANCAIEIALNKPEGDRLKNLLDESEQVLAPDLLIPEFVNALWKYHQFNRLTSTARISGNSRPFAGNLP